MTKRIISSVIIIAMLASVLFFSIDDINKDEASENIVETVSEVSKVPDDTLIVWYTDDVLTEYLEEASLTYRNLSESSLKTKLYLVDGVDYIENINRASIADNPDIPAPDLYITTHDNLMKAYLAGLASEVTDPYGALANDVFPSTSMHAIRCNNKNVAYPFYYETNFFLYNKTYMATIAQNRIESESDVEEAKASEEELEKKLESGQKLDTGELKTEENDGDENNTENTDGVNGEEESIETLEDEGDPMGEEDAVADQAVLERLATMIPSTISDVITFANNYEAPDAVEAVFKWDITDIFYNYFFVGNYMEVGGEDGDNNAFFNLYNKQAVDCLSTYQSMNQYFSYDKDNDSYDSILKEFIDGKLVFTVATTDAIAKISDAKAKGEFDFDYGITVLPDMSDILKARGLSVTDVLAVNGYSTKKQAANELATFIGFNAADTLYNKTGKIACKKNVKYDNDEINNVMMEYEKSMPLPKMIETSNFWLQLEVALAKIWDGNDPDEVLKALSDQIGGQIEEITYSIPVQESIGVGGAGIYKK